MVTHDVGLKNFADRIIWMRDGKIQRIEMVPRWKREEAIKKVEEDLAAIRQVCVCVCTHIDALVCVCLLRQNVPHLMTVHCAESRLEIAFSYDRISAAHRL